MATQRIAAYPPKCCYLDRGDLGPRPLPCPVGLRACPALTTFCLSRCWLQRRQRSEGALVEVGVWWAERGESQIRTTAPGLSAGAPLSHLIWLTKQTQNYKKFQANNHRALNPQREVCLHVGLCTTALISGPFKSVLLGA